MTSPISPQVLAWGHPGQEGPKWFPMHCSWMVLNKHARCGEHRKARCLGAKRHSKTNWRAQRQQHSTINKENQNQILTTHTLGVRKIPGVATWTAPGLTVNITKELTLFLPISQTPKAATSLASPPLQNHPTSWSKPLDPTGSWSTESFVQPLYLWNFQEALHLPCLLGYGLSSSRASLLLSVVCFVLPPENSSLTRQVFANQIAFRPGSFPPGPQPRKGSDRAPSFSLTSELPLWRTLSRKNKISLAQQC